MEEFDKRKFIDIKNIYWGEAPSPLLPKSLRAAWVGEILPHWVRLETGLFVGSTIADLGSAVWDSMSQMSPRLKHFLVFLVRLRSNSIRHLRCVERNWPLGLKSSDIAWGTRTKNCLSQQGLLVDEHKLVKVTFGDLFAMEGMGALSVLDFSATLEGAMEAYDNLVNYSTNRGGTSKNSVKIEIQEQLIFPSQMEASHKSANDSEINQPDFIGILEETVDKEWAEQVSEQDPRFASLLPPGQGTLQERTEKLLSGPDSLTNVSELAALAFSIQKVEKYIAELKEQSLECSLLDFLKLISRVDGDRLNVLAVRLGWAGEEPATLEECGKRIGVTRERIRQIQDRTIKRIPKHPVFMPKLDQALALLEQRAPITSREATRILHEEGVTEENFHPCGILDAATLLGRETTLRVCETRAGEMLINEPDAKVIQRVPRLARKLAGQSGVTSIFQVAEVLREEGFEVDEIQIRRTLRGGSNFEFLSEDWFWATDVKDSRNRLCNITRKILSIASPQNVLGIRDGVRRQYRWRISSHAQYKTLTVPPLLVLEAFYKKHPSFRVEDNMVYASETLDHRRELGDTDCVLVEVLRSSPSGLLDRDSFAEACVSRGMNEHTFNVYTSYSPILENVDLAIWKLRGVKVDPTAVEAIRIANYVKPRQKRVLHYGWGEDGSLWIAVRVPRMAGSMVIGCPGPIQRFLSGQEFTCLTKDGNHNCGTITVNDRGSSYGYGVFIRRHGIDENDVLLAEFDLNDQTVTLSIADEELLDWETL